MNQPSFSSRRILRPVRPWFIWLSLLVALVLNLMPLGRAFWLPDWVALVLCFWCVREPLRVGMGSAFVMGVVMDVGYGSLMGQHALAYTVMTFLAIAIHRRLLWFPVTSQAFHVLPLLVAAHVLDLVARLLAGGAFPGLWTLLAPLLEALLWPVVSALLLLPQKRAPNPDAHRPL